ncbi:MAG: thioredoxin domain-containing protein, partial [Candidatus Krumholzibacteria bacterium]|nr:thioredoxin domain-containing protein [Candidatus Krumholzibacteria bacterium]
FEKMLYDQAMLSIAFLETHRATGNAFYGAVAEEIFAYVLRDLASPEGGFYSAEDADSEGEEGTFYVWTKDEITEALGEVDSRVFCERYGVTGSGNFEGKNVLHISSETGADEGSLGTMREKLLALRAKRPRPMLDDKILADWNGLMIAALARGARVTGKPEYAAAAAKAAGFILGGMRTSEGRLLHRYRDGESAIPGYLDDYAFLIWGLIELYEATFDAKWLSEALALADGMLDLFGDNEEKRGGLFFTGSDAEKLIVRTKEIYDGAVPSGNSVAALALLRLGRMTGRTELESAADALMEEFSGQLAGSPTAYTQMLIALDFALGSGREYVIAGERGADDTESMIRLLAERFMPRAVTLFRPAGDDAGDIISLAPVLEGMTAVDGKPTAYICENFRCSAPVTGETELRKRLSEMEKKYD